MLTLQVPDRRVSVNTFAGCTAQQAAADFALTELPTGAAARVVCMDEASSAPADLQRRLAELGFLPGERLRIVARGFFGRDPIAVRIGTGTFALRSFEAACIRVRPES